MPSLLFSTDALPQEREFLILHLKKSGVFLEKSRMAIFKFFVSERLVTSKMIYWSKEMKICCCQIWWIWKNLPS